MLQKNHLSKAPFPLVIERGDTFAFAVLPGTFSPTDRLNIDFAGESALVCAYTASCLKIPVLTC